MGLVLGPDGHAVTTTPTPIVQLRETMSLVQRAVEDLRWDNLTTDSRSLEQDPGERKVEIERARQIVRRNPLARVATALLKHYVLGQGISVKAANRALVAKVVDDFINNPVNRKVLTSHVAMQEFLETLWTDGDFFVVLFPDERAGTVTLGYLDALYVVDVITDPQNAKVPQWYKVKRPKRDYDFATDDYKVNDSGEFVYYRDWQNEAEAPAGMASKLQKGLVYQVSKDKRGKFGRSVFGSATSDWVNAHREFMQDRASLNKAAASIAWRKKRKGPASDIAAEAEKLRSSVVGNANRFETNPPRAAASTIVENEGTSLDWVETNTGGSSADYDERKLRMMAGAAMGGIPNHYFGDEGNANLATATAMELPLLKQYEDAQQMVRQTLSDLIEFMLGVAHQAGRIGEKDDSDRYTERETTRQAVMDQPEALPGGTAPGPAKARMVGTREALTLPYAPPPIPGGVRLIPKPEDAKDDTPQTTEDPEKKVSWYVDIDFPPIVQKQLDTFMTAVKTLADLLPSENIESRKLVVELALATFGVNDIDREMARIFPADMVAVLAPPPPAPPELAPGDAGPPKPAPVAESIASIRRRRLLRAVDDATEVLEEVG